ncbi:hypothetical protein NADFUDRAFT_53485 [Nadsonia fulvescens var. elongata DSM 6958]|uniref:HIT-type domain-containing protein n=1 Tax=Nadsonia fulvescens var. elongata DSM 6958 TaxID=857566 RepID=A0A1E3PCX1_9ASCO|nr:hypothetical protein NADFUDRAFT_53485 [Nadsonia fulvescens var. elongata DSM 6958]
MGILDQLKSDVQEVKDQDEEERKPSHASTRTVTTLAPLRSHGNHSSVMTSINDSLCHICSSKLGIYTCPRCLVLYCDLSCYKNSSHSNCSEQFYKESIQQEMKGQDQRSDKGEEQDIRQMITILNKFEITIGETSDEKPDAEEQPNTADNVTTDRGWKYILPQNLADKKRQVEMEIEIEQRSLKAFPSDKQSKIEIKSEALTAEEEASLEELVEGASVQQLWELLTPEQREEFAKIAKTNGIARDDN